MRGASPTTAQGTFLDSSTGRSVFPILTIGGSLSPRLWCSEMYDFALVGCKPEDNPCRPFMYGIHCLLYMYLYGVQRASLKTDRQVIDKELWFDGFV